MKKISIDPITRLEGHGKIDVILNDEGDVDRAYFQIPELRGFERFAVGRPVNLGRVQPGGERRRRCGRAFSSSRQVLVPCL